ncbi:MxaD protein [Methylobacterium sp. Leaf94]|uniref:SRPBCC family protein n=1 Tax=Methylobacterium sp. Leaf94 TaxID=1736250 RepID=UPI0006FA3AEB|nr:SRPBCC family protein [Methylobacterium sp. Leaf94]KQU20976.1 MxaD protein [Methylobacterium sp. Leaf94]
MRQAILGIALTLLAGPAGAIEVSRSRDIPAPAAAVWALIGGFCSIALWHPQVVACDSSGTRDDADREDNEPVRRLVVAGGLGTLVEAETRRDEAGMSYSYAFIEGPLPVGAYNATLQVRPNGTGATVVWSATFDPAGMGEAEARADIEGVYDQGLDGIARELGAPATKPR